MQDSTHRLALFQGSSETRLRESLCNKNILNADQVATLQIHLYCKW